MLNRLRSRFDYSAKLTLAVLSALVAAGCGRLAPPFKIRGRVTDQYGRPANGVVAEIRILHPLFASERKWPVHRNEKNVAIYHVVADQDGYFWFDSGAHRNTTAYVFVGESINEEGDYFSGVRGRSSGVFGWRSGRWHPDNHAASEGRSSPDDALPFRVFRSGPPESMVHMKWSSGKLADGEISSFNVLSGKTVRGPCADCDLEMRIFRPYEQNPASFINGKDPHPHKVVYEIRGLNGTLINMPAGEAEPGYGVHAEIAAPEDGYAPMIRFADNSCGRIGYTYFLRLRDGRFYARMKVGGWCDDEGGPVEMVNQIRLNPRGTTNLNQGGNWSGETALPKIEGPMIYENSRESFRFDLAKIEVLPWTNGDGVILIGHPGAAVDRCLMITSTIPEPPDYRTSVLAAVDGSFVAKLDRTSSLDGKITYYSTADNSCKQRPYEHVRTFNLHRLRKLAALARVGKPLELIPWQEDSHLDFSKIYVSEDRVSGTVTVRGLAGAVLHTEAYYSMAGFENPNQTDRRSKVNPDGSFLITKRAELRLLHGFGIQMYPSEEVESYYLMPLKLKSEAARATLASSAPLAK